MPNDASPIVETLPNGGERHTRLAELVFLLASPGLSFLLMHFKPVMQNGFLDPYIYTGYINNFLDLFQRYGTTYYGVRFGLIVPGQITTAVFGSVAGYFVLRYALALLAGLPFYALIRQRYGRPTAIAAFSILMTSPFLARTLLWDHPDASGVPFLFAALCLWSIEHRRRLLLDAFAGLCAGMAIHSNIFTLAPFSVYVGMYSVLWLAWRRGVGLIAGRLLVCAAGMAIITGLGALYYWWRVNDSEIFSVTMRTAIELANGGMATWRTPGAGWIAAQWWVLTPVFLAVLAPLVYARRPVTFHDAVIWTGASGTTVLYYVIQFLLNGNSLQLFYYFSYALPVTFLLLALVIAAVWEHADVRARGIRVVLLLAAAIGPWLLYSLDITSLQPTRFTQHLAVVGITTALLLASRRIRPGRPITSLLATAALGFMFFSSFAGAMYAGAINSRLHPVSLEMDVYRVALQFIKSVPAWSHRPGTIRFWYSNRPLSNAMQSIQSTYLWGYSKVQGGGEKDGLPELNAPDLTIINNPDVKWLALLAERQEQLAVGRAALLEHGVAHTVVDGRALTAGAYTLHFELLELHKGE